MDIIGDYNIKTYTVAQVNTLPHKHFSEEICRDLWMHVKCVFVFYSNGRNVLICILHQHHGNQVDKS